MIDNSATITVTSPNTQTNAAVTFPVTFNFTPKVYLTLTGAGSSTTGYVTVLAFNATTTGFILMANSYTAQSINDNWKASEDN